MTALSLIPATERAQLDCIENLMQFFNYELSAWYPVRLAEHGLYRLRPKAPYWAEPRTRPYLLQVDGEPAGFAVVDGDCLEPERQQFNLGYFFIVRRFRGQGLARQGFAELLRRHPGAWELYYLAHNQFADGFWPRLLPSLGLQGLRREARVVDEEPSVWFRFDTA